MVKEPDTPFIQSFSGNCLQNVGDHDRIRAAADEFRWKRMTDPQQLKMFAPEEPGVAWSAWSFRQDSRRFVLAISSGEINGEPTSTCSVMSEVSEISATKDRLVEMTRGKLIDRQEEGGQLFETYHVEFGEKKLLLILMDGTPIGISILRASVATREVD